MKHIKDEQNYTSLTALDSTEGKKEYTFQEVAKEWAHNYKIEVKPISFKTHEEKLRYWVRTFNDYQIKYLSDIRSDFIQQRINDLYLKQGLSKSTLKKYKFTLSMIMEYAKDQRRIIYNPCKHVKIPKFSCTSTRRALAENEIEIINKAVDQPFGLYPYMMLYLGLRRSELAPLTWEDIDFDSATLKINKIVNWIHNRPQLYYYLKNGNPERFVPIPKILLNELKNRKRSGLIFSRNENLLSESQLKHLWNSYLDKNKLYITQHMLRHTYATLLFKAGVDIKSAQQFLGHKDIHVTLQIYTHLDEEQKRKNIVLLDNYITSRLK